MRVGLQRKLSTEELTLLNCGVREDLWVPWTSRRSNKSILKEISPGCSLEGLMLKLKLQSFGHLMGRADSFEKTLMLRKSEGGRRRGWQRMRWLDLITDSMDLRLSKLQDWWWTQRASVLHSMVSPKVGHDWVTEMNWSELICIPMANSCWGLTENSKIL